MSIRPSCSVNVNSTFLPCKCQFDFPTFLHELSEPYCFGGHCGLDCTSPWTNISRVKSPVRPPPGRPPTAPPSDHRGTGEPETGATGEPGPAGPRHFLGRRATGGLGRGGTGEPGAGSDGQPGRGARGSPGRGVTGEPRGLHLPLKVSGSTWTLQQRRGHRAPRPGLTRGHPSGSPP